MEYLDPFGWFQREEVGTLEMIAGYLEDPKVLIATIAVSVALPAASIYAVTKSVGRSRRRRQDRETAESVYHEIKEAKSNGEYGTIDQYLRIVDARPFLKQSLQATADLYETELWGMVKPQIRQDINPLEDELYPPAHGSCVFGFQSKLWVSALANHQNNGPQYHQGNVTQKYWNANC